MLILNTEILKTIKSDKDISGGFLNYDRRVLEGNFVLDCYFNNPNLSNLIRYLTYNFKALTEYIKCYIKLIKIINRNKNRLIKFLSLLKFIIIVNYSVIKFIVIGIILFVIRFIVTLYQQIFNIVEFIFTPLIYLFFKKKIKLHKKLRRTNDGNNSSNNRYNKNWLNLKEYYLYIIGKILGKVRTNKKIIKPNTNINLQNISFIKRVLVRSKQWIKLKVFNLRLINMLDNNKNKLQKNNSKIQIKIIKKILKTKNKNENRNKNIKQSKNKSIKIIKEKITKKFEENKTTKPNFRIKNKIKQIAKKVVEIKTKIRDLEIKGEKILINSLSIKITKNFVKSIDNKTNLLKIQQKDYKQYKEKKENKQLNTKEKNTNTIKIDKIVKKENVVVTDNKQIFKVEKNIKNKINVKNNESITKKNYEKTDDDINYDEFINLLNFIQQNDTELNESVVDGFKEGEVNIVKFKDNIKTNNVFNKNIEFGILQMDNLSEKNCIGL